jgi:N-methylhydantoinase B/oxoprolinase/acetone carboxylase alpha subunit
VEIRYRTRERFGNITQKGQPRRWGAVQDREHEEGRRAVQRSIGGGAFGHPLDNDYRWHVIRASDSDAVEM